MRHFCTLNGGADSSDCNPLRATAKSGNPKRTQQSRIMLVWAGEKLLHRFILQIICSFGISLIFFFSLTRHFSTDALVMHRKHTRYKLQWLLLIREWDPHRMNYNSVLSLLRALNTTNISTLVTIYSFFFKFYNRILISLETREIISIFTVAPHRATICIHVGELEGGSSLFYLDGDDFHQFSNTARCCKLLQKHRRMAKLINPMGRCLGYRS